ncbi:MAG: hypothetical protein R2764_05350 [Bacteroidales bacterium]
MNRKVITIIIILTSVSLLAALITQLFWVRDAWLLKKDQFDNSVKISLKSVVNQIMTSGMIYSEEMVNVNSNEYWEHLDLSFSVVNPDILDSLLIEVFEYNQYGLHMVYTRSNDKLLLWANTMVIWNNYSIHTILYRLPVCVSPKIIY